MAMGYPKITVDGFDLDLGGMAPVLFDLPGATPSHLLMQFGKDTYGYLLDRSNLGGIGAPLIVSPLLQRAAVGASITYKTAQGTYVVTRGPANGGCQMGYDSGHLVAINVSAGAPPTLSVPGSGR